MRIVLAVIYDALQSPHDIWSVSPRTYVDDAKRAGTIAVCPGLYLNGSWYRVSRYKSTVITLITRNFAATKSHGRRGRNGAKYRYEPWPILQDL